MSSRGAGGLPSGWKEATAADGRTYYFHAASGETSWERPVVAGSEDSGKSTAALAVKVKPVIPSVPTTAGIGKLPNGWRMVSSPEGKPYYFNKKTGETLWERPAGYDEDDSADTLGLEKATLSVKDGWRRTKQVAAATVGLGRPTGSSDDAWLDGQYEQVLQVERQMLGLKQMCEAYAKSLVDVMRSSEQLATKFGEYLVEPGAVGTEPARQSAAVWKEVNKIGQRSLEVQFTSKVLQPLAGYLGEIEGIKKLHAEHLKKKLDFDYYRRKVDELTFRPPKDAAKLPRNAEKLREREADHWNCKNELIARLAALIAEKWDFANAPLLHLLEFQQRFHTQMSEGMRSLSAFTYEGALSSLPHFAFTIMPPMPDYESMTVADLKKLAEKRGTAPAGDAAQRGGAAHGGHALHGGGQAPEFQGGEARSRRGGRRVSRARETTRCARNDASRCETTRCAGCSGGGKRQRRRRCCERRGGSRRWRRWRGRRQRGNSAGIEQERC